MAPKMISVPAAAHCRDVVLLGYDEQKAFRGCDKTPEHITSAMTQSLNADENSATTYVGHHQRLMEQ